MTDSVRRRAIRERLFAAQNGKCYYCNNRMILERGPEQPTASNRNPRLCTLEHIYPKGHAMRQSEQGYGRGCTDVVVACYECNRDLGEAWSNWIQYRAAQACDAEQ